MSLPELLEAALRRHGPLVALESGEVAQTYAWLDRATGRNADLLRAIVEPDSRVLVVGEHSPEAIVWAFSVMRSGLIYTPLNPHLPTEQMRASISVADPGLIICFDESTQTLLEQQSDCRVLRSDHALATDNFPNSAARAGHRTSSVAYSIFTSGSTGLPKLVNVGHEGLPGLCTEQQRIFDLGPGQRVVQFSALSFDASIAELLVTLYAGATLVVPERRGNSWLSDVNRHLSRSGCDLATFPPSVYARLDQAARQAVGAVVFAGETLTEAEYARAAECGRVYNAYGPTEGSVCFSLAEVTGFSSSIGRPIAGFRARVFDAASGDYTQEGRGELVIVGPGVALGYEGGATEDWRRSPLCGR